MVSLMMSEGVSKFLDEGQDAGRSHARFVALAWNMVGARAGVTVSAGVSRRPLVIRE